MNYLSVDCISKSAGEKELFNDVSFGINKGNKMALLGINGCGKTTLLNILSGELKPDTGIVARNRNIDIRFLKQIPDFNPEHTVLDHIFSSDNHKIRLVREYERLCDENEDEPAHQEKMADVMEEMERLSVWEYENEVKTVLQKLAISDLSVKMKTLSGGMLKKVALAAVLVSEADLLLLDEPTNHLDMNTIIWLQEYLKNTDKAIFMVTHDRYFLDEVCDGIVEINRKKVYFFNGDYRYYLEKREEIENSLLKEEDRINTILRTELKWLKSGVKARTTKARARKDRVNEMLNREKLQQDKTVEFTSKGRRLGKHILEVENISKSYDGLEVVKSFSYVFKKNEKIGLIGPNGSGKTTFLNLLSEKVEPTAGFVNKGVNTVFGFFDQHTAECDPEKTIVEFLEEVGSKIEMADGSVITCSSMLERFLFPRHRHYSKISELSGGERKRLYLVRILMTNPNFLILDEPTNDLDIMTLSVLEEFLIQFPGCVMIVSHDRYFLDKVADHLFIFDSNYGIQGFPGKCSEFVLSNPASHKKTDVSEKKANVVRKSEPRKKGLSFKEKKELEELEILIMELEEEKTSLEEQLAAGSPDREAIAKMGVRYDDISRIIIEKESRWEILAELEENSK